MENWQFALFFAALLAGYLLVHARLVRFEEHLRKLGSLRSIDDRLGMIIESVDKATLERVEVRLDRLHEDLEDLREAAASMQEAVINIPQPGRGDSRATEGEVGPSLAPVMSSAGRVLAVIETRLLQLGYGKVQVLGDLAEVGDHGDAEVQVECERNGMPAKGTVRVRNFRVRDVDLQTVARMFP